ncbi:alpha-hydroxy-acid oxidizing protein [Pseudoroseomonas wenyumeiae]|uniref:Alpha-hydroxy-acid oxidizing protein n=1 Tax=Teichococcus wenyumeiae TaxID=2478470 RepID=A0A3A9JPT7_9PROT|nr:alpha-hydroxy acid oxidase [Pseudoroseomonas wenyumeiae]RKK02678.1 alpha-hydroxy-acid oxidizing protein [Pseudoroseomonas wenyumeiae]RMI17424.1 alpha-hydroxy-acid oxidizing protein [Pseudoroseomonas wenyumeiae]
MISSRRNVFQIAGAGLASAVALSTAGSARAQVREEASRPSVTIIRKGIDKDLAVINVDLLEEEAKRKLPEGVHVFIANGNGEQWTLRENRRAFGDYAFAPHRMGGVVRDRIDTAVTLLGESLPFPIFVSPMGSHGLVHPEGEVATARGMGKSGGLVAVSSASTIPMEDIARASDGPKWFQMYLDQDEGRSREILQRARAAGFKAIVLTVDAIGQGSSDQYANMGRPRPWLPYGNYPEGRAPSFKTDLSWRELEMVRSVTGLPVVIKGLTRPEDAAEAVRAGAGAIQVSNHGGRALDGTPASISVLPKIVDAVQGAVPVMLDSGIRRGTDVAKALALGASAVAVGRPVWWALTLGGAGGVSGLMDYFQRELVETMLHLGVDKVASLGREHVLPLHHRIAAQDG